MDEDLTPEAQSQQAVDTAILKVIRSAADIDNMLTHLLAAILHPPPNHWKDFELASFMVFGQGTVERRANLVRQVLELRLAGHLSSPRHLYPYKLAAFLVSCFNKVTASATEHLWIRNMAAHGDLFGIDGEVFAGPAITDFDARARLQKKKKITPGAEPLFGLKAVEIEKAAREMAALLHFYDRIGEVMITRWSGFPPEILDEEVSELGRSLGLASPLQNRPLSKSKKKNRAS